MVLSDQSISVAQDAPHGRADVHAWLRQRSGESAPRSDFNVVDTALFALHRLTKTQGDHPRATLYNVVQERPVIAYAERLMDALEDSSIDLSQVRPHALWLLQKAAHREPLKLGVLLLGLSGTRDDLFDLKLLARHDEFALFAALAVERLCDDPTDVWWDMARHAVGWGRVALITLLSDVAYDRPDIQRWLIRYGWRTTADHPPLWRICASSGRLARQLQPQRIDTPLLLGASALVSALTDAHSDAGASAHDPSAGVVLDLLRHMEAQAHLAPHRRTLHTLTRWLRALSNDAAHVGWSLGWSQDAHRAASQTCATLNAKANASIDASIDASRSV